MTSTQDDISWEFPDHTHCFTPGPIVTRWEQAPFIAVLTGNVHQLWNAFYWRATQQGYNYWYERAEDGVQLSQFDREQLAVWMGLAK